MCEEFGKKFLYFGNVIYNFSWKAIQGDKSQILNPFLVIMYNIVSVYHTNVRISIESIYFFVHSMQQFLKKLEKKH